jgi:23S rRNA pseudouridine2605 synthase
MFEAAGLMVSRLIRTRHGPISLPKGLKRGRWEELEDNQVRALMASVGLKAPSEERGSRGSAPERKQPDPMQTSMGFISREPVLMSHSRFEQQPRGQGRRGAAGGGFGGGAGAGVGGGYGNRGAGRGAGGFGGASGGVGGPRGGREVDGNRAPSGGGNRAAGGGKRAGGNGPNPGGGNRAPGGNRPNSGGGNRTGGGNANLGGANRGGGAPRGRSRGR